ncbi:CBS domain-containing protein [Candidatus Nitrosotenuis chungbukensis]|uniref:CBS domain-containing protein n=1 Tax=Candidatus Nitrosotenuis chungbukensis TaxID=1353246 RepID=UPI0026738D3B|nr:CBS domain-containing protein [Candidatus Nitrosotenuis chungbukensis]WKT58150.1 CBS domain-containing protein [Candidatus Nitrosotenuis chungbukensis]
MPAVKSIMKKAISIPKESSVAHAIRQMLDHKVSRLLVSKEDEPVGIVTERDVGFFFWQTTPRKTWTKYLSAR